MRRFVVGSTVASPPVLHLPQHTMPPDPIVRPRRRRSAACGGVLRHALLLLALLVAEPRALDAQIRHVGELTTREIQALDRSRTVVLLQGGMLEEHGPYLPAFTDGILSARLASTLADSVAAQMPGWTVLVFPPISVGTSGSNEIGGQYVFPGTYAVRPSVLRAVFMDLATEPGEQRFRRIFVVHVHGSPLHINALDQAGNFFHDTYGGTMVNLWGLLPVLAGWGSVTDKLPAAVKKEDGVSLHGGLDEHSMMLHLAPSLVAKDFRSAPTVAGASYDSAFAVARRPGWPGYLGAPRLASAMIGKRIWDGFASATVRTAVEILKGKDPSTYPRYMTFLRRNPLYRRWIAESERRDSVLAEQQRAWVRRQPR